MADYHERYEDFNEGIGETRCVAYAITDRGRELIESYETAQEAIDDMLKLWPEDDEGDVSIEDDNGLQLAYFARSAGDPNIVHVYHVGYEDRSVSHVESYRCEYRHDRETGRLYTQIDYIA